MVPAADLYGILNGLGNAKECHLSKGFYCFDGKLSRKDVDLECSDGVSIILCDNASLELKSLNIKYNGILSIYGQKNDNGQMTLKSSSGDGIGLWEVEAYSLNIVRLYIHGGVIKTEGGISGCRIPISIFGGMLTAKGTGYAGVSAQYGDIYIYGGTINATGGVYDGKLSIGCAGIGGSYRSEIYIYGGEVTARGGDDSGLSSEGRGGAGIGGDCFDWCKVVIEGDKVTTFGGYDAPGIGNGWGAEYPLGEVTIRGGDIYAYGGKYAAGIGSSRVPDRGYSTPLSLIEISGGTVHAYGGSNSPGIGGWSDQAFDDPYFHYNNIIISGGKVYAYAGDDAAGIGGGHDTDGGIIKIEGGKIRAIGGTDGAGIGSGEDSDSEGFDSGDITGGSIFAEGSGYGCGIGAGKNGKVKSIKLLGGSVEAQAGEESTARAIGSAAEEYHGMDNVTFGDLQKAMYNLDDKWTTLPVNDRKMCAFKYQHAIIAECEHQGIAGTPLDANRHYKDCPYCLVATKGGVDHTFDDPRIPGYCTGCGIICVDANADNSGVLTHWNNRLQNKVGLSNYTLHTDGRYNIVTLPFALNEEKLAASCLKDATIKQLGYSRFEEESGTLKVHFEKAYSMKAGQPYVIVWDANKNTPEIKNPIFELVTPTTEENPNTTTYMDFIGNSSPYVLKQDDATRYILSESGIMQHPSQDTTLVAFRGYYQLAKVTPEQVSTILIDGLKFGDDTGIDAVQSQDGRLIQKFIRNGVLYIRKGGRFYDAAGREVLDPTK